MDDEAYKNWLKENKVRESKDYDTRAAYRAGVKPDSRGHLPDEYKLSNHITYSSESLASKAENAPPAGTWEGSDETGWVFNASITNIKNAGGVDKLKDYFKKYEPGVKLNLPAPVETKTELPKDYRKGGRVKLI